MLPFAVVLPSNIEDKRHAFAAKLKFSGLSFSDHIALSKVFKLWSRAKEEGNEASFCRKNFVSNATMEMVSGMRNQLINHLRNFGFIRHRGAGDMKDLNSNSQNWSVIKAVVLTGAYPSLLKVDRESGRIVNETEKNIRVHPSSVLSPTDGMPNILILLLAFFLTALVFLLLFVVMNKKCTEYSKAFTGFTVSHYLSSRLHFPYLFL